MKQSFNPLKLANKNHKHKCFCTNQLNYFETNEKSMKYQKKTLLNKTELWTIDRRAGRGGGVECQLKIRRKAKKH